MKYNDAMAIFEQVSAIDPETIEVRSQRRMYGTDLAAAIRMLLKDLGFSNRKISVKKDYFVTVKLPQWHQLEDWQALDDADRSAWNTEWRVAWRNMQAIIDSAYPKCNNRSDAMIDHFDAVYYVS